MNTGKHVGKIGTCSECHQQKKITLEWNSGKNRDGNEYSPYLRCEDCTALFSEVGKID